MSDDENLHMTGPSAAAVADEEPFVPPMDLMDDGWMDQTEKFAPHMLQTPHAIPQPQRRKGVMDLPFLRVFKRSQHACEPELQVPTASQQGLDAQEPGKTHSKGKRFVMVASLCGIALLVYLQYGQDTRKVLDLLGSRLPATGLPNPMPDLQERFIDPRFADGDPLPVNAEPLILGELETEATELAPGAIGPAIADTTAAPSMTEIGAVEPAAAPEQVAVDAQPAPSSAATAPATSPFASTLPTAVTATLAAPARAQPTAAADADMLARMQRLETMLATVTQQLADMKAAQAHPGQALVANPTANSAGAPQPAAKPIPTVPQAVEAESRPAPKLLLVKAEPSRAVTSRPSRQKPAAAPVVAEKPKSGLGGQLVSVDMWNGEPSVVVTSGIPGDRRVRVLRPGDVVNGLSLKSADPVARTATFVAPGSQGLTLSVNSGG